MRLDEAGESRVRGYLYVLERSLRTFLPRDVVAEAVREVESHIRERMTQIGPPATGQDALARVLRELGPPLQLAQAYSLEMTVDEAIATGRVISIGRALWHVASTTIGGFLAATLVLWGYASGVVFLILAAAKPILPLNIVFTFEHMFPIIRFSYPAPAAGLDQGGYWVIPFAMVSGFGVLIGTHNGARRWLAWWIDRRRLTQLKVVNVAPEGVTLEAR